MTTIMNEERDYSVCKMQCCSRAKKLRLHKYFLPIGLAIVLLTQLQLLAFPVSVFAQEIIPSDKGGMLKEEFRKKLYIPVTADFRDVDFESAIGFLSESAGVNIVLSEEARAIGRPVTVHLVEMTLKRALEHILKVQGLLLRFEGNTIWVATRKEMEDEPLETRVMKLKKGPGLFATFESIGETRGGVALQAVGIREMRTIRDILMEVIPQTANSSILLDERTGFIIVTHVPYYLDKIEILIDQLDVTPPQVLIEARFVEVTVTDTTEWGFDATLSADAPLSKTPKPDGSLTSELQFSQTGTTLSRGTLTNFTDFASQTAGSGLNLTLQGILTGTQYSAVLHALTQNDRTKTLSAPRVMTLSNQTATIKIVTEYVYATRYEASVIREDLNNNGNFTDVVNGIRETRFVNVPQDFVTKDLGILLRVTPSVGQDMKTITLALHPEVTEKKTDDSFGGEVILPRFTARDLETSVVIESGQTVMLGGLMKDTSSTTVTKVPILGSIPYIGKLFRKESEIVERSNLLIFVTAQIIETSGAKLVQYEEN